MGDVTAEEVKRLQEIVFLRTPVDIATFVTHKDYLGKADFWPMWLKDLQTFFETEHYLGILRGSIGCGKTTFADVAIGYMTYQLSCLKDPAAAYGLLSGSTVALICVSVNMTQAKRVVFKRLKAMLEGSPYFREHFPANWQVQSELRFPKAVWVAPVASNEQNVIGENVFGGVVDEGNFMPVIEESKRAKARGGVYDRAQVLFDALRRRMKSRFPGMPGRFMLISSEQYPDDFIDRTCRQYRDDPGVLIRQYTVWEPRPKTFYCGETFSLEIGTAVRPTRILTGSETDIVGEVMRDVPIEYKKEFEDDPDGATRDIAGRSTLALTPFITDRASIRDAIDPERQHPMTDTVTTLRDGVAFAWERLCTRLPDGSWVPKYHPERLRYIHIDLGLSHDWAGLAMGCCAGTTEVERKAEAGIEVPNLDGLAFAVTKERVPLVWYDFLLSVKAPPFEQIMFGDIRTVIYELVNHGFRIQKVSFDSFGSISEIQTLQQKGYDVEKLSVDTSMDPYLFLRTALHERRVKYYEHPVLLKELVQLEHHKAKKKVDHPPSGSKDQADGAAGVAYWVHLLGMTDPPVIELGLTENAPSHKIDARDDCKAKDCTKKAEVRGYCREHWDALEQTTKEKLIEDRSDVIWELPGMTDDF